MYYKNRNQRKSIRLKNWDYCSCAKYFVTICIKNNSCLFGDIIEGEMRLSDMGKIANFYWYKLPEYSSHVVCDEFVVMPNHIHGIILINKENKFYNIKKSSDNIMSKISPKPCSLPSVIRTYKSLCTRAINKKFRDNFFKWQGRYYERIIKDAWSLENIRKYIRNNPRNWDKRRNNLKN